MERDTYRELAHSTSLQSSCTPCDQVPIIENSYFYAVDQKKQGGGGSATSHERKMNERLPNPHAHVAGEGCLLYMYISNT